MSLDVYDCMLFSLVIRFSSGGKHDEQALRDSMTQIIPLSFLIHGKYFYILHWDLPFLMALRTELPLWKWPILLLSMIFGRGHTFSLFCQSLEVVFICAIEWFINHIQIICPVRPIQNPDRTAFLEQNQWKPVLCPREDHSLLGATVSFSGPKDADRSCLMLTGLDCEQKLKAKTFWSTWHCPWSEYPACSCAYFKIT